MLFYLILVNASSVFYANSSTWFLLLTLKVVVVYIFCSSRIRCLLLLKALLNYDIQNLSTVLVATLL